MMLAMRGVVLALLVLCTVPGSHSPTVCIEGGVAELPLGCRIAPRTQNFERDRGGE